MNTDSSMPAGEITRYLRFTAPIDRQYRPDGFEDVTEEITALRAEVERMRPVVEAAKVESAEHAAGGKCFGRDGYVCPLCDALGGFL